MVDPDTSSDGDLISRSLLNGEDFLEVFERHYDPIRRYLQRRAGIEVGEELAAETFEVAFSRRSSYDFGYPSARPWLFGIASNVLRHYVRHEHARRAAYARLPQPRIAEPDLQLEDRVLGLSLDESLKDALSSLRTEDRDVLWLFAVADLSYEEIGFALSIPVGTVRSRLSRSPRSMWCICATVLRSP